MQRSVQTADGRTLAVEEAGDPDGIAVLMHSGTPNSRHLYRRHAEDAASRGLRLISYDRPGYGESTSQPGRTVADCASDTRDICAALDIGQLLTWGISGGGPHVLACAALLPDLVVAAASVASLAPYGGDGLDFFAGMGQENVDEINLVLSGNESETLAWFAKLRDETLAASPETIAATMQTLLTPTDAGVLTGELAEYLDYTGREGLAPGYEGYLEDSRAFFGPWGFDLSAITVPVLVVHGRQDQFVPQNHGAWLAAHIPGAHSWLSDDDGHLTLFENRIGEVHEWLLGQLQAADR
jgi:pimeloyl-ACP methyl ester carboxylesterase